MVRPPASAYCFLHERADPCLFGGGQLLQREGGRPHVAFVEVCLVAEAECRVPRFAYPLELTAVLTPFEGAVEGELKGLLTVYFGEKDLLPLEIPVSARVQPP
jgi:hypothetical protein